MPIKLDIPDPFGGGTPSTGLDIEDPFQVTIKEPEAAIPVEEPAKGGITEFVKGIPSGAIGAVKRGIPAQAAGAMQFGVEQMLDPRAGIERGAETISNLLGKKIELPDYLKVHPMVEEVAAPFEEAKKFYQDKEVEYMKEHPEYREGAGALGYEIGKMGGESIIPMVGIRKAAMTGATKLLIGATRARKAGADYLMRGMETAGKAKLDEAAKLSAQYVGRQAFAGKVSSAGVAGLFGLSQAQETIDNAKEQGVAPGIMPYLTGMVEAIGEYYGTKYLNKLFKVAEGKAMMPSIMDFLKTAGVETSTEFVQNGLEAAIEKYSGIRPTAEPMKEALSAIPPTAGLSLMTFGLAAGTAHGANYVERQIEKWEKSQRKSAVPTDLTTQQPIHPVTGETITQKKYEQTITPRAVEQPMTRAEKEYSDWWNEETRKKELLRQSPEGRNRLAEQLAEQVGLRATVPAEQEAVRTRKETLRLRKEEAEREGAKTREFLSREIGAIEEENAGELKTKMEGLKKRLSEERVKKAQTDLNERLKAVAAVSTAKKFDTWLNTRVAEMNKEVEGSGDTWLNTMAENYDVKRDSKNFAAQLKRGINAEAAILGFKTTPQKVEEATPVVEKPVSPTGETKPYAGLTPGTKEWKTVWKAYPELQKEMADIAKQQPSPTTAGLGMMEEGEETDLIKALAKTKYEPGATEEAELLPKHQAIKLVNKPVTQQAPLNDVMDIFDGVDHIAVHYGMALNRKFQNLNDTVTRQMAQKIQEVWRNVSGGVLFRDINNASEDIKQKINTTNQIIDQMSEGAAPLMLPKHAETIGRPRKEKGLDLQAGEVPALSEKAEDTETTIEDLITQIQNELETPEGEPNEAALKDIEPEAENILQEIDKVEKRIAREKKLRSDLQVFIKAKRIGVTIRGKTWDEIENDVQELLDGLKEEKEKEVEWQDYQEAFLTKSEKLAPLSDGTIYIHDSKEWELFFDMHREALKPTYAPNRPYNGLVPGSKEWLELVKQRPDLEKEMVSAQRQAHFYSSMIAHTDGETLLKEAYRIGIRHQDKFKRSASFPFFDLLIKNWGHVLRQVKVNIINSDIEASAYDGEQDIVTININTQAGTSPDLGQTIIHELAHALSSQVLRHDEALQKQFIDMLEESLAKCSPNVKNIIDAARKEEAAYRSPKTGQRIKPYITSIAAHAVKQQRSQYGIFSQGFIPAKDWELAYAHSDIQEFLAMAFDSATFRAHLNNIKLPAQPALSLYQKILRAIHQMLTKEAGTDANYSMLDKVLTSTEPVFNSHINQARQAYVEKTIQGINVYESFNAGQLFRDIQQIGETNLDIKTYQKYLPMHILGKFFGSAKKMLNSWQEGQRTLNRTLYQYEYTVDPVTGKERTKSFLTLSHPLKPNTPEQKLFDRMSYEGDLAHRDQTRADLEQYNSQMGFNISREQLDKVEHAYNSIREHYTRFWNWYWDNVQKVAIRPYERKVWYTELVATMLDNNTQITPEVERDVRDQHGNVEFRRFTRARDSMLAAWDAIAKSRASMVEGYAPRMRQQGAYRVNVKNAAGEIIATQFATNKWGAAKLKYSLEKEYPNQQYESFHTSTSPENIFSEFDKQDLESFINTITGIMERTGEADEFQIEEFYNALSSHIANKFKPTGFRTHQIQRVGQAGAAIQGYKTDNYHENALAYFRNGAGSVRKMNFAFDANNILRDIQISKKEGQSDLFKYLKQYRDDMLRNEIAADKLISNVRSIAFLYYLAANIKASAVNATQNFILGIPVYARTLRELGYGINYARAAKEMHQSIADIFKMKAGKTAHLTAEELDMLENAKMDGDSGAMQMSYMSGAMDRSMGSRYTYLVNLLGTPFSAIESINREAAMLAFYRLYRRTGLPEGMSYVRARDKMYDVHFPYGKHNYPELVRAKGVLGQVGHLLSTFRSYSIMYVSTILESFRGTDGKISWRNADVFFGSIALLVLLGGLSAPWVDDILDKYERMTGRPVRSMIRERLRRFGGDRMAWAGMHGLPALLGVDITGSLKIGVPLIGAGGIEETITGAYAGLEQKIGKGAEAWSVNNYYRALEEWSPTFLSNAMKAVREASQGATNIDGTPVNDPEMNQYRPNLPEAVLQSLGFRIERRAEISEEQRSYRNTQDHMAKRRDVLYAKYRMADTDKERDAVAEKIAEYNDDANELGNSVPSITNNSLRKAMNEKFDKRRFLFQLLFNEPAEDVR